MLKMVLDPDWSCLEVDKRHFNKKKIKKNSTVLIFQRATWFVTKSLIGKLWSLKSDKWFMGFSDI